MHKIEINSKWIMNCLSVYDDPITWSKLLSVAGFRPQFTTRSYLIFSEATRGTILFGNKIWLMSLSLCGWWQSLVHVWLRLWHVMTLCLCSPVSRDIMSPAGGEIKWPARGQRKDNLRITMTLFKQDAVFQSLILMLWLLFECPLT